MHRTVYLDGGQSIEHSSDDGVDGDIYNRFVWVKWKDMTNGNRLFHIWKMASLLMFQCFLLSVT